MGALLHSMQRSVFTCPCAVCHCSVCRLASCAILSSRSDMAMKSCTGIGHSETCWPAKPAIVASRNGSGRSCCSQLPARRLISSSCSCAARRFSSSYRLGTVPQRRPTMWAGQHAVSIFQARCLQLCAHLGNQISHTIWWPWLPTCKAGLAVERVARREAARMPARRGTAACACRLASCAILSSRSDMAMKSCTGIGHSETCWPAKPAIVASRNGSGRSCCSQLPARRLISSSCSCAARRFSSSYRLGLGPACCA